MKILSLAFLLVVFFQLGACQEKAATTNTENTIAADSTKPSIAVLRSPLFANYTAEKMRVADFVEAYFNLMFDSTLEYRNAQWDSKILIHQQDYFLRGNFPKEFFIHYSPKILGIREASERRYEVKLEIEQNGFTYNLMNLIVTFDPLDRPYFIDTFGENLQQFDISERKNTTFYYSPKTTKNERLEQKMAYFNLKMSQFFNLSPKKIAVVALKNLKDYTDVLGYDYITFLTYDGQTGGIAMPEEQILISANNSPYYPHELVHLYTADLNPHNWFDEGCATYLGGSVEFPLEHHLRKVAAQMDSLDFSELPKDQKLDDDTSLKYSLGGLFCNLAIDEYGGKESLFTLLNSGKTEEDFHAAIKNVFGIEKEEYDTFVREKLEKYKG